MANKHNLILDDIYEIKKKFYQINSDNSLDWEMTLVLIFVHF